MVFSSLSFLFLFMPITIVAYSLIPPFLRNGFLFLASLLFYCWGEPHYIWIMLFSTFFDYTNGRLLEHFAGRERTRKIILWISILGNLGILGFFKYSAFAIHNVNALLGTHFYGLELALPIGISFYTFQTMSYTIDVYRGKVHTQHNLIDFGMYVCLFPQLIAGPIVRYEVIADEIGHRKISSQDRVGGLYRFAVGLAKKVLLANQIGSLWEMIRDMENLSTGLAWLGALAFTLQIYFDFSGYSDMAIGLGRIFGFHFPENFDHPYKAKSIAEFWRRWHKTMGQWFREYVYIPLGGNRCGKGKQIFNLFLVWSLTGLWHGAGWNFVIWGWFYGILLILERFVYGKALERLPSWLRRAYVMLLVMIGWMIFAMEDLKQILVYLKHLLPFGRLFSLIPFPLWDATATFYLTNYGSLLLIGLFISWVEIPDQWLGKWSSKQKNVWKAIVTLCLLSLSLLFLIGDGYNPFLYFRF